MYLKKGVHASIDVSRDYDATWKHKIQFCFQDVNKRSLYIRTFLIEERYEDVSCYMSGSEIVLMCDWKRTTIADEIPEILNISDWIVDKPQAPQELIAEVQDNASNVLAFNKSA
jgi:hypothetical protein